MRIMFFLLASMNSYVIKRFLSIQAQDFIEDPENAIPNLEGGVNS